MGWGPGQASGSGGSGPGGSLPGSRGERLGSESGQSRIKPHWSRVGWAQVLRTQQDPTGQARVPGTNALRRRAHEEQDGRHLVLTDTTTRGLVGEWVRAPAPGCTAWRGPGRATLTASDSSCPLGKQVGAPPPPRVNWQRTAGLRAPSCCHVPQHLELLTWRRLLV